MPQVGYTDGFYKGWPEAAAGGLLGKEFRPVELTAGGEIQELNAGRCVGILDLREQTATGEKADCRVRLIGGGGTYKIRQTAGIAGNAFVKLVAGGIAAAGAGESYDGIKLPTGANGAAGDIVEVLLVTGKL